MGKIAVLGDGGWGTALAIHLCRKGHNVYLWSNFPEYARILAVKRENPKFLPGIKIPEEIVIGSGINDAIDGAEVIVLAIPTRFMRQVCQRIRDTAYKNARCILNVAKGIETDSLKRMSSIIEDELPGAPVAVLSGPSHAEEVGRNLPTAIVAASSDIKISEYIQALFTTDRFRVYTSDDIIGVELGGALKNIIAIAVGICEGLEFGDNAMAAIMTRGNFEITKLGVAMGGKRETFSGLAGIGDIIVTSISKYGRNLNLGRQIASGKTLAEVLKITEMVVEGVSTAEAGYKLGIKYNIDLPIINEVYNVLYKNKACQAAMEALLERAPGQELL